MKLHLLLTGPVHANPPKILPLKVGKEGKSGKNVRYGHFEIFFGGKVSAR